VVAAFVAESAETFLMEAFYRPSDWCFSVLV